MKILVFDTCFNKSYIVFSDNDDIVVEKEICNNEGNYHSAYLIPEIRNILKQNNMLFSDIDAIGVNIGPGSFTGIRAGITIARVLAQQTNINLVGVCSLDILYILNITNKNTVVVTDARKNKVYFAKYSDCNVLVEPMLLERDLLIRNIDKNNVIISDTSIGKFLNDNHIEYINYEEDDNNLGIYLSEIVLRKLKENKEEYNWAKVKPLYIQPPSITKSKEVKQNV